VFPHLQIRHLYKKRFGADAGKVAVALFRYFIKQKISNKMTSNILANVEYLRIYGQKTDKNKILIKQTVFWP
jgi:hypothetical protein